MRPSLPRLSLKAKIALMSVALIVLISVLLAITRSHALSADYLPLIQRQQQAMTDRLAESMDQQIALHVGIAQRLARGIRREQFEDPKWRADFLRELGGSRPLFDGISLVDARGRMVANDPPRAQSMGIDVSDRAYFKTLKSEKRPVISEPLLSRFNSDQVVIIAAPALDARGEVVGLLNLSMNLKRATLLGAVRGARVGNHGYATLSTVGPAPIFIYHPDATRIMDPVDGGATPRGPRELVTSKNLTSVPWRLSLALPESEALAPIIASQRELYLSLAFMALLSAALIWVLTWWLLLPLDRLEQAARQAKEKGTLIELPALPDDEIGELGDEILELATRLHERDAEMSAFLNAAPLGLYHCDTEGRFTFANDICWDILGLEREHGFDSWQRLMDSQTGGQTPGPWRAGLKSPEILDHKVWLKRPDGARIRLWSRRAPLLNQGKLAGHVGVIQDITAREAQERSEQLLRAIFESTTDFIAQTDGQGTPIYLNPAARARVGMEQDESLEGKKLSSFFPPKAAKALREQALPAVLAKGSWMGDSTTYLSDGDEGPVSLLALAHKNEAGEVERFSAIMRDTSNERAQSAERARSERTLNSLAEALPVMVAVVGADETLRFVNTAFEMWVGQERELLLGASARQALGNTERLAPWIDRALRGEAVRFETDFEQVAMASGYGSEGPMMVVEINLIPLREGSGPMEGFVIVAQDVSAKSTERKELIERARRDPLTALYNRDGFQARLKEAVSLIDEADPATGIALLYLDLDGFKKVNDTRGHGAGDELLREFAARLREACRPTDIIARLGGDEFAIALVGVKDIASAEPVAQKILALAREPFIMPPLEGLPLHASIGVSVGISRIESHNSDLPERLEEADRMLYEAKRAGKNQFRSARSTR